MINDLPETITKVFTKYDQRIEQINVPTLRPITVDSDPFGLEYDIVEYRPCEIEQVLEGVIFIHYRARR